MDSPDASIDLAYIIIVSLALVVLLILSALFSSMETAFVSCSKIKMRALVEDENSKRAKRVLAILDKQNKMLTAILICNNVVNLSASAIASLLAEKLFGSLGVTIATGILTFLVLIFGEISPKTYATIHADNMALKLSGFLQGLMVVLTPFIFVVSNLSKGFLLLLRTDPDAEEAAITEEELRVLLDVSHEDGVLEKEESEMIKNVVDFGDSLAKEIMIPRVDITFVQADMTYEELIDVFRQNMFTRMPVYEETPDEVVGVINMKDVLLYQRDQEFHIRDFMRDAFFTIESKHTSELLAEMRENSASLSIVIDEYGATAGMITMEDLLEEIVGEIRDEYDDDEKDQVQKTSEGEYIIDASMKLNDINDWLGTEFSSDEYDSLGGFVMEKLDHIPEEGEVVEDGRILLTVERVEKNRLDMIRLKFLPEEVDQVEETGSK